MPWGQVFSLMTSMDAPLKDCQENPSCHIAGVVGDALPRLHTLGRTRHKATPTSGLPGDGRERAGGLGPPPAGSQVASGSVPQAPGRMPSPGGPNRFPQPPQPRALLCEAPTGPGRTPPGPHAEGGKPRARPQDPSRCVCVPRIPPWRPTTRSPTCTLPLRWFCCDVFYERADGMARARGKVLPWDKKLTLANSKFTACIFIFLIPAPSASNWGSTSPFSPLISPARSD